MNLNDTPTSVRNLTDIETFVVAVLVLGAVTDRSDYATLSSVAVEQFSDLRCFGCTTTALTFVASGELSAVIAATSKSYAIWSPEYSLLRMPVVLSL